LNNNKKAEETYNAADAQDDNFSQIWGKKFEVFLLVCQWSSSNRSCIKGETRPKAQLCLSAAMFHSDPPKLRQRAEMWPPNRAL